MWRWIDLFLHGPIKIYIRRYRQRDTWTNWHRLGIFNLIFLNRKENWKSQLKAMGNASHMTRHAYIWCASAYLLPAICNSDMHDAHMKAVTTFLFYLIILKKLRLLAGHLCHYAPTIIFNLKYFKNVICLCDSHPNIIPTSHKLTFYRKYTHYSVLTKKGIKKGQKWKQDH